MRLPRFLCRAQWDRERLQEMKAYLQIETDENVARGMRYEEAYAAASRKLGNQTLIREEIYHMNSITLLDTMARDLKHGFRLFRRSPTFTAAALLTLTLGISASTLVFSLMNSILLKPLAYPNPDQLVAVRQLAPGAAGLESVSDGLLLSPSMYFTYADHNRAFQSIGVWTNDTANVTGIAEPEQVRIVVISGGVLEALAVSPAAGRRLLPSDQLANGPKTVMLGYAYWQRRFAGDRAVIGRTIKVDAESRQIVGVMPRGFRLVDADFDLLLPAAFNRATLTLAGFGFRGVARLKPGITFAQANADLARLLPVWMDSWSNGLGTNPHFYEKWRISPAIRSLKRDVIGNIADLLWVVMATVGVVMLIACANVTNLMLVRVEARQQELAVRAAIGAGWPTILRGLLTESALLGLLGGGLATGLAYAGLRLLVAIGPADLPRLNEISLDARAILFTLLLCLLASLLVGLIPALKFAGPQVSLSLRSAGRTSSANRERHRTRNLLVVGQVAMAMALLVSAGLMIRTFQALRNVQPGFRDAAQLQTMRTSIPASLIAQPERVTRLEQEITRRLSAVPGVSSAAFVDQMPMEDFGSNWDEIDVEGSALTGKERPLRLYKYVSPGFFHSAGTRLISGRELTWQDIYDNRPVILISENLAREFWGSPSAALGKHLREFESMPWHEVIGVVENTRENGVDKDAPTIVYWPPLMHYLYARKELDAVRTVTFVVRSDRAGSQSFIRDIQQTVWAVEPSLPVASVRTMEDIFAKSVSRTSFTLTILGTAAAIALVLGVIGVYGVISYAVSQRRREIGIRLALGAQERELKNMFVRSGLGLAAVGLIIGLVSSFGLTRFMTSLLFGVTPLDPVTYVATAVVLALAVILASYFPARRAAKMDPVTALRAE